MSGLAEAGFDSAAPFYYAARLLQKHGNRETVDVILARCRTRLTDDQWAYVERLVGLPPTGQLSIWAQQ